MSGLDAAALPLRDIHLPAAVPWWPPAPGWWLLALGVAAGVAVLAWRLWRARTHRRRQIRRELDQLSRDYRDDGDVSRLLQGLSALLRRASLSVDERAKVASLTGTDWLRYLDGALDGHPFSNGPGRVLIIGPYARASGSASRAATEELIELCRRRLEAMPL